MKMPMTGFQIISGTQVTPEYGFPGFFDEVMSEIERRVASFSLRRPEDRLIG
jgi:hypothetical protein